MNLTSRRSLLSLTTIFFVSLLACSSSEIGESCDTEGSTDDCVDNAICGKDKAGVRMCLKICVDKSQCAANEDCNGVTGSNIKGCRPN